MVHKPKHKVHSFRGLLGDGGQDEINLERQNVNLAYRIIKFEGIAQKPASEDQESVIKIFKEEQTSLDAEIDFDNPDLLGVVSFLELSGHASSGPTNVIFDNELFSRNIYVSHADGSTGASANYYIEIEEVPVGAATLMQLKLGTARKLIGAKMGA